MKILLANKFFYPRGGDCIYTINLARLLEKKGHHVAVFAMDYADNISVESSHYFPSQVDFSQKKNILKSITRPLGNNEVKLKFNRIIEDFGPDLVHLNNIHSQLSPVIAEIAYQKGIPVVWTLHDYKLLCPRYDCLRNGLTVCEDCFENKTHVLKYSCMKNSRIASLLAYLEALKWNRAKLETYTDCFICPSNFMKEAMMKGGFSAEKLIVQHNFLDLAKCEFEPVDRENYICYVGRLSHEKGVETLIKAAVKSGVELRIVGSGPMEAELKRMAQGKEIRFLGYKQWDEIKQIVARARFMVIPSQWYENNPLSVLESLALGTPVLGANIGGIPELINQDNGRLFESGNVNDLSTKIDEMLSVKTWDCKIIAQLAKEQYSDSLYYELLMSIYNRFVK